MSGSAGHSDVKAVVDQEIAQEIARLEAKIDAVISKYHLCFCRLCTGSHSWNCHTCLRRQAFIRAADKHSK